MSNTKNKIWFTSKLRMRSEERFKHYDSVSHVFVVALSVAVIGINLFQNELDPTAPITEYTIFLAVFIMAISIVIYGFRFSSTATLHRECYLKLRRMADEQAEPALTATYHEILASYPNHSELDMHAFVVHETLLNGKTLQDADGHELRWSFSMLLRYLGHLTFVWILPVAVFIGIILPLFVFWK